MGETDPYRGWDPVHLRREIGRLHEEMQSMAVLAEIDRNAYEALKAERDRLRGEVAALRELIAKAEERANERAAHTKASAPSQAHSFTRGMKYAISLITHPDEPGIYYPDDAVPDDARGEDAPPAGREGEETP